MANRIERTDDDPQGRKLGAQQEKMGMAKPVKHASSKGETPKPASPSEKAATQVQQGS
ncbi:hypothetical protein HY345_00860 [Candidatus Microgenomates bacterium]|nr:hypothetical protein [Candidatus Microgenomates bacterium]